MIQQYLSFTIEDTQYAINVFHIQEVLEYEEPVKIPCSSSLLKGVIRSRDTNIAIMDIRSRFGLEEKDINNENRIIVLEITDQEHGVINLFGIIADSVQEVLDIDDANLEPLVKSKKFCGAEFVSDLVMQNNNYLLILDVNKLFSEKDISNASRSLTKESSRNKKSGRAK